MSIKMIWGCCFFRNFSHSLFGQKSTSLKYDHNNFTFHVFVFCFLFFHSGSSSRKLHVPKMKTSGGDESKPLLPKAGKSSNVQGLHAVLCIGIALLVISIVLAISFPRSSSVHSNQAVGKLYIRLFPKYTEEPRRVQMSVDKMVTFKFRMRSNYEEKHQKWTMELMVIKMLVIYRLSKNASFSHCHCTQLNVCNATYLYSMPRTWTGISMSKYIYFLHCSWFSTSTVLSIRRQ